MIVTDIDTIGKSNMVYCSASVNENYFVVVADDFFYNFMGKAVGINVVDYIAPDCLREFNNAFQKVKPGKPVRLLTKLKGGHDDYQIVDIHIKDNGHTNLGAKLWDLEIYNICSIENKHIKQINDANKYRLFLSIYNDILFDYDFDKDIITIYKYFSIKPTILYKCSAAEFYAKVVAELPNGRYIAEFEAMFNKLKNTNENFECEVWLPSFVGDSKTIKYSFRGVVTYKQNRERLVIGVITPLDADHLADIPFYNTSEGRDVFTGLFNKRACEEYIMDNIAASGEKHYMAMMDVDNFKNINDTYGHMYGDEVILKVATIINSCLNGRGIAGRFGGDEFFIFTNWITDDVHIRSLLTSIRQKIADAFSNDEKHLRITLSIGVSLYPDDGQNYAQLFDKADKCLYLAKSKGKNRFIIYDKEKHSAMENENNVSKYTMDVVARAEFLSESVSDIAIAIAKYGKDSLNEIADKVRNDFDIDGIRIYRVGSAEPIFVSGQYTGLPDMEEYVCGEKMLRYMKNGKHFLINDIYNFEGEDKVFFERNVECGIQSIFCATYLDNNEDRIFIYYDSIGRYVKKTEADKNNLLSISKMIVSII